MGLQLLQWAPEARETLLGPKGVKTLVTYAKESRGASRLPAVRALGLAGSPSSEAASEVVAAGGMVRLALCLPLLPCNIICNTCACAQMHAALYIHKLQRAALGMGLAELLTIAASLHQCSHSF